ncbi:MAG TPA: hypothetical protein VGO00_20895, partial [Kofleriaceae bacterium]|nr:hypothetical protein [Kofleriaceae bacterium]
MDLGPVTVCDGSTALVEPAAAPGGLGESGVAVPVTCSRDSDCRDREACACGRCTVPFCTVSSDCPAPRICNFSQNRCDLPCTTDEDCGDAENCISSVCRGRCADDRDCQHDELCDGKNVCVSVDCSDDTRCRLGDHCDVQHTPRQVLEPAAVTTSDGIVLYLDLADPTAPDARSIWRAVSGDGVHFTLDPDHAVIDSARAPSAVVDPSGLVYIYYEGDTSIEVATSPDGVSFDAGTPVLAGTDLHAPTAVHTDAGVVLYYATTAGIGLATGPVGGPLDDHGVVLAPADVEVGDGTPGTAFWIGITTLASPHAIIAGPDGAQTIHLWFAGFGQESSPADKFGTETPTPPNFSVGFAAADLDAPDELHPWPYGPVADRVEVFTDHRNELGPSAIDAGGDRFLMYYVDAS